jgi:photosystem II stability/assembly factor-like uncharacterized protein
MCKMFLTPTLYAVLGDGIQPSGIYRSDDNGRSWQMISPGPPGMIHALAVHPTAERTLYATTGGGSTPGSLWYSNDGGQTWDQDSLSLLLNTEQQPTTVSVLSVDPHSPGILYIGTEGRGLYRFHGVGEGYELVGGASLRDLFVKKVVVSPDGQVYALTTSDLFVINGDAWHRIESLPDLAVSLAVDPASPQTLYAGAVAYGAYRSDDGGQSWQPINTGLGWQPGVILRVSAITIDEDNTHRLALATAYGVGSRVIGGGIYESFNAGESWDKVGDSDEVLTHLIITEGGIYAATTNGLIRYGEPLSSDTLEPQHWFRSLANPTGTQGLILILTAILAGWALVGRLTWMPGQKRKII